MIAEMDQSGVITIRPETGAEAFALRHWSIKAEIDQSLPQYAENCVIRSSMLVIRHQVEELGEQHDT